MTHIFSIVPEGTAAYDCLVGYLTTWKLVLSQVAAASSELRPKYSEFIRREKYMETLMPTLFHLMPQSAAAGKAFESISSPGFRLLFPGQIFPDADELQVLACCVYYALLGELPAMVRVHKK